MRIYKQNYTPKTNPLPHQIEAIDYIAKNTYTALFDEQGLGKTKIVIDGLSIAMKKKEISGALIVAPLSLVYVWESEVKKHSHLIPITLRGTNKEKRYRYLTGANFYITNYEAIFSELDTIKRFCRGKEMAIVLDEAPRIKNPKTKTAKSIFEIAPHAKKRVIITGTPVANKPQDLWAQYYFLDAGELMGKSFSEFCYRYNEKNPDYKDNIVALKYIVGNNSMRRLKNDVLELPEKVYKNINVALSSNQRRLYDELREELRLEISDIDGNRIIDEVDNILKKLLRLSQIASNPFLLDKSFSELPSKVPVLLELVDKIISQNEKVIIWTSFVENILYFKSKLSHYKPLCIYGDIPTEERIRHVEQFQNNEINKVLIANPAAAREGLTLTKASKAIYYDRNFSLIDYLQSQDRIHRISQTNKCIIYKIIADNTVDEYIDYIIDYKSRLAGFIQGDENLDEVPKIINKTELLNILGG